ncbi:hypothetical protein D1007_58362 [Hordeum vulgare]|nr:hypothetical protein D1007_58362 [Hordeum vulgare]
MAWMNYDRAYTIGYQGGSQQRMAPGSADADNWNKRLRAEAYCRKMFEQHGRGDPPPPPRGTATIMLMAVIDLALKLVNPIVEPREVFPNINGIHLVIGSELRDHRVVGVESTLNHPLAVEDLLLHCFEPRLHASGLLRPLNITDVQHPLAHLDRLRVFQHFRR